MPGFFALYVGGDFEGTRLSFNLVDKLAENAVPDTLDVLFGLFAEERAPGEGFGDFCYRVGREALLSALTQSVRKAS
jgi:sulfite reductase (ferredoxin)